MFGAKTTSKTAVLEAAAHSGGQTAAAGNNTQCQGRSTGSDSPAMAGPVWGKKEKNVLKQK